MLGEWVICPSDPAYYIEDWRFCLVFVGFLHLIRSTLHRLSTGKYKWPWCGIKVCNPVLCRKSQMFCIKSYSYRHVFSLLFYFKLCWILVRKPMVSPHTEFPSVATIQAKPCTNARTTDAQWSLFSLKSRIFGLGQTNWADKFWGIWGYFRPTYQHHNYLFGIWIWAAKN